MKRTVFLGLAMFAAAALPRQISVAQETPAAGYSDQEEVRPGAHVSANAIRPATMSQPSPAWFTPAQIRHAYGFDQLPATVNGKGQTIAIVDAFGDRYASITAITNVIHHKDVITYSTNIIDSTESDWTTFCNQFGLAASGLTVVYPQGQGNVNTNWALETALDIQWAHAIAPGANILLVIARDSSPSNMYAAVDYAVGAGANVVSMSFGGGESTNEFAYDAHFNHPGVAFVAASGDAGESSGVWYPAASPYVLSVGGTQLTNFNGAWSESTWSGSGGGVSLYEPMPSFQSGWQQFPTGNRRSVPDVCYQGGPNPGVAVYVSAYSGWIEVYGTSVGAPQWAALVALANSASTSGVLANASAAIYSIAGSGLIPPNINPSYMFDMTSGSNGSDPDDSSIPGYDFVTGLGSPAANNLVPALSAW